MKLYIVSAVALVFLFGACSTPVPQAIAVESTTKKIDYLKDVKPILDKRCVSCHSCYNSPCQAKLSSFDGVDRGASKLLVYDALRINAAKPTRLFVDAQSTQEWRGKGFYSLTQSSESNATHNDSIMIHLLYDKKQHPELIGEYSPEKDDLICPRNKEELGEYFEDKPNHGMPYGLPAIKESEYKTLSQWLQQGAKGPNKAEELALETPSKNAAVGIQKFEAFFNQDDAKHRMSARYLYEHLYLAHIYFPSAKGEFYQLIRSTTPSGHKAQIIPTVRPFDDPKVDTFYYRLVKIRSTIVHKTHITFQFDDAVLKRFKELFIAPKWVEKPHDIGYSAKMSANPFRAFEQIPVRSRYQFLLDNSHYIVMNFIRGPVCRGQMALNVIPDHIWMVFKDPKYDLFVQHPEFIQKEYSNLELPIESNEQKLLETFSDKYREKYKSFIEAKLELDKEVFPQGMSLDSIWKGDKNSDAPMLTIYRHFDSASVHKGALGEETRTMWVIDYSQLEKIYYTLVAGYDVFGNISHQTNIRRYTDFLRAEGEVNFIEYMPQNKRAAMFKSWYIGDSSVEDYEKQFPFEKAGVDIAYRSANPKNEFITMLINKHFLKGANIHFDPINYKAPNAPLPQMPQKFEKESDFVEGARSITLAGSGFITFMTDRGANNMFLRINMPDGTYIAKNLVINRWHDNVNSLFNGEDVLDASKDTMDILDFSIGSYPNAFIIVDLADLADFMDLMKNMTGTDSEIKRLKKYFISRSNPHFWEIFDWFNEEFKRRDPINAGMYDLNRYARTIWKSE